MLNNTENLLVILTEECSEIMQSVTKALRFGPANFHPDRPEVTNADDIMYEFLQLEAVIQLLQEQGTLPKYTSDIESRIRTQKRAKIEQWNAVSQACGTLGEE